MAPASLRAHGKPCHANARQHERVPRLLVVARSSGSGGNGGRGRGGGGRAPNFKEVEWRGPGKLKQYKASDGIQHLGSSISTVAPPRPFPGPPPDEGPPLRVLPIGGLGEIGMNCMLVGVKDRYIVIDAGLMFPDFTDLGMQKILPDTSFLHEWRDKIEALVITHGHEDHIGALPWVVPALDPSTPIYATSFVMQLIKRRLTEYSIFDETRFRTFEMRTPFDAGPFQIEAIRVTHSIPDCCGLIMRSDEGTIVHTGDWKIDETPIDGQQFDRETFDLLGKEKVALFMSDSTNVLATGRTMSEKVVHDSIVQKVLAYQNQGRVIVTQFASNLARLYGVKAAADASGRKICFVGASLSHYLEAAWKDGRAPFDPKELIAPEQLKQYNPNEVIVVSTGSQGEPNAQLTKAAREAAVQLKIMDSDLILYSAKVIPGNEPQVSKMMNSLTMLGARVMQGRGDNLHTSGHAYQDELKEVMRLVKPQHFLPVHGEYSFLTEHARLAREEAGVQHVSVIKNGQMLGIHERSSRANVSSGSMANSGMAVIGRAELVNFYNDGNRGTGNQQDMALAERNTLALEGVVVVAVDVRRDRHADGLQGAVRVTTRGMWTDKGKLRETLFEGVNELLGRLPPEAPLAAVERSVVDGVKRMCDKFNRKRPEVICIAHEQDPRSAHWAQVSTQRQRTAPRMLDRDGASTASAPASPRVARPWEPAAAGSRQPQAAGWGGAVSDDDIELIDGSEDEEEPVQPKARSRAVAARRSQPAEAGPERIAITRLGSDGEDSPPEEESATASQTTTTQKMLATRRKTMQAKDEAGESSPAPAAPKPRARRSRLSPVSSPAGELQVVPSKVIRARKAANPRDNPADAADPESLAYD